MRKKFTVHTFSLVSTVVCTVLILYGNLKMWFIIGFRFSVNSTDVGLFQKITFFEQKRDTLQTLNLQ